MVFFAFYFEYTISSSYVEGRAILQIERREANECGGFEKYIRIESQKYKISLREEIIN